VTDLNGDRGDTNLYDLTAKQASGAALNLTGVSLWFTIKRNAWEADPGVVQKTVGSGINVTDAVNGLFTVTLDPNDTKDIEPGRYSWDCQVKETTGRVTTVDRGDFFLMPDYTRATT